MRESFSNEVDDINFVIRDLQYSSLLHIPFYTRLLHHFFSYFGKINSSISAPAFLGYIYFIIVIIQSFLPAFLVDCEDLWPRESLMSMILYVLGYFFQGPHPSKKSARIIMSIIVSIIFIILFIILIIRALHYHKTGRVSSGEIKFIYFTFKYIMPIFCPHLMSGVPISFDQIINQNKVDYNILQIILSILSFVFYIYLLFAVITPRVILEDTPSHDWFPLLTFLTVSNTTVLTVISGIAGCVDGKNRSGCSIWMAIESILIGLLFYLSNGVVKMIFGVIFSAIFFASAFTSILLTINIFMSKPVSPEILFVVSFIVLIVLIIVFKILKQMKVTKTLQFLDNILETGDTSTELFESNYKRPFNFLSDMRSVIEIWIQFAGNFELFETAVFKWPDHFDLLLFYSRLLAIFPNKSQQLTFIFTKISKLEERTTQTPYLYQFRQLLTRTRQTAMTSSFRERLEQINSKTEIINDTLKRFWENILQKNTVNFWSDSDHVLSQIQDLDSLYAQLLDDYPNNYQLLNSYQSFVTKIKRDFNESHETSKNLVILKQNGSLKSNLAFEIAVQVFPLLNNCIQSTENNQIRQNPSITTTTTTTSTSTTSKDDENVSTEENNDDELNELKHHNQSDQESNNQLECALTEVVNHSKLGIIWITCVILVVITVVVIVVFYLYVDYFAKKFINKQRNALDFLLEIDMLCHALNFFCVNVNIFPLILENETVTPISINNRTEFTKKIAPVLFEQGKIPEFSLTTEALVDLLSNIRTQYAKMVEKLSSLNKNDDFVKRLNYLFYNEKRYGATLNDMTNGIMTTAFELLKVKTLDEFYRKDGHYYSIKNNFILIYQLYSEITELTNEYASSSYESNYEKLNELMILVTLIALFLITLPYLIQLFLLIIQSESIAESFSLFPNTEIRSIINDFGKESSKMEEDTSQVAALNNIRRTTKLSGVTTVLTFLASFIVVLICSLIIYLDAYNFIESAESVSNEIYTLTPSFASLYLSFTQVVRLYMLSHDGNAQHMIDLDSNLYGSSNDNLTETLNSAFSMTNLTYQQFSKGMWSVDGGMDIFNQKNNELFDYFNGSFPTEYEQLAPVKTFFEEIATNIFTESISHIKDFLWYYLIEKKVSFDNYAIFPDIGYLRPLQFEDDKIQGMIYWFSNFSEINRTQIYFKLVQEEVYEKLDKYKTIPNACLYFVIVWQILACIFMILFLINRHTRIKKSLLFYMFIKPEIILQNQKVLSLIETGRQISKDDDTSFSNGDYIISKISQGVIVTEKDFSIVNFNDSFIKKFRLTDPNINGSKLTELVNEDDQDKSWTNFIQRVEDSISGKFRTQFQEDVTVNLKNGQVCHLSCIVTCLTRNGVSNGGDYDSIEKVSFIFDDNTEMYMKEQLIMQEKKHLNEMLSNVMPARMIHSFVNSGECISFIVQSVSIGMVRIKALKDFDKNTSEEFAFYDEIFNRFDTEIKQFDLLTKINNFSHTYSFVGGLFSEINKPERHAEEAIKFSLKLLSIVPELSQKYGIEIHLTIGVHTGGPIVAGVLSFDNPTFQIIGTVGEMANQVKNKGVPDQICITRAVYELIFSASFKVQEQGDTKIRGGKIIPTYLVRL